MDKVIEVASSRLNFTATNTSLKDVNLMGIIVASASSTPTIKVADAAGTIVNTMAVEAGRYYPIPVRCVGQVTITVGGTVDATAFYGS